MLWWLSHGEGRDAVGINCKKGATTENQDSAVKLIGILIECFHGFGNTSVTIDVLIINVIYGIVTIRLSLIC